MVFHPHPQRRTRAPSIYGNGRSTFVVLIRIQTDTRMGEPSTPAFLEDFLSCFCNLARVCSATIASSFTQTS